MDSGWGGSSYTGPREAGPFAIADSVYTAIQKVLTADPTASFPLLNINWSVNNVNDSGGDRSAGLIGGSFYDPNEVGIYLLGEEDDDTEEYDPAVIIHEWGHYFDDQFVRNESPGGPHFLGDALDMRVAWGEGFATGLFSVLMDITEYVDTGGVMQGSNLVFQDVEDNSEFEADEGWFSETSVQVIVYDLYDSTDDGDDTITLGFGPLYSTLTGSTPFSPAMSTVFTFAHHLKADNPGDVAAINSLLSGETITTTALDEFDSTGTETNDGGEALSLPVYRTLIVGSPAGTHCSTGAQGNYNAIANRIYFRVVVATNGSYDITAVPDADGDPVIWVWDSGTPIAFEDAGGGGATEVETVSLSAGTYVVEVYDRNIVLGGKSGTECFDVSIQ